MRSGFAMFSDIRRICEKPTDEDRAWFPEHRGQRLAEGARLRHAQLQGRVVHRAIPVAAPDPRAAPVRHRRPPQPKARSRSTASTTTRATAACASSSRGSTRTRSASPTCRSCATTATATGRSRCAIRSAAAGDSTTPPPRSCVHLRRLWGFPVRLETWEDDEPLHSIEPIAA